jgi:2,5-diketo-D-gluconate reductase A
VPAVNQIQYHPTFQQRDLETFNTEHQILTEAWSPLGMGTALRHRLITAIADRTGATPAQVIIAWHLHAGRVVIPKSSTPTRIAENYAATELLLSAADVAAIDRLNTGRLLGWDPEDV